MQRILTHLEALKKASGTILATVSLCFLMVTLAWTSVSSQAIAQPLSEQNALFAWGSNQSQGTVDGTVGEKIREGIGNVFGSDTTDRIEGAAKENMSKVKGRVNPGAYEKDGLPAATEGQAIRDAYTIQEPVKRVVDELGETAEKTGAAAQDVFNK